MRDRLAAETKEEREARLQQMRVRLAVETPEERSQAARKDSRSVRTFVRKVNSVCFGGDIPARQLERSSGGLQGQGYEYPAVSKGSA